MWGGRMQLRLGRVEGVEVDREEGQTQGALSILFVSDWDTIRGHAPELDRAQQLNMLEDRQAMEMSKSTITKSRLGMWTKAKAPRWFNQIAPLVEATIGI